MPRFFIDAAVQETVFLSGEDGRHIARSLRMQTGDLLTLCDGNGKDYLCRITSILGDDVTAAVESCHPSLGEPDCTVTLYQGLPKADKMDHIVQKAVETGASRIVPVLTERCISRPDPKSAEKKRLRWEKIAAEAAKQCERGKLPVVSALSSFSSALNEACANGPVLFFYEGGGENLRELLPTLPCKTLSIFIGPEGGFAPSEAALARSSGAHFATLGPRILRTETAPTAALTAIMLLTGNLDTEARRYAE